MENDMKISLTGMRTVVTLKDFIIYQRRLLGNVATIFVLVLLFDVTIFRDWLGMLYPIGDEFSLIVESARNPLNWFLEGYSKYFIVYSEFFSPYTNFIRPVANLLYRIFSCSEGCNKLQLIMVNYGTHALITAVIYFIGVLLGNSKRYALGLAGASFLAPAFWGSPMRIEPAFSLDGVAALFCFLGTFLLLTRASWVGLMLLALAAFTKETALPVVAAVAVFSFFTRRTAFAAAGILIILGWVTIRFVAFEQVSGGTYVIDTGGSLIGSMARATSFFLLPVSYDPSGSAVNGLLINRTFSTSLWFAAFNVLCWCLILAVIAGNRQVFSPNAWREECTESIFPRAQLLSLYVTCAVFSTAFFVLTNGTNRFSYVFYVCFLGVLAATFPYKKYREYVLGIMLLASGAASLLTMSNLNSRKDIFSIMYEASQNLVQNLKAIGNVQQPVFVVNDFVSGYSSQQNVARFAGASGDFFRGSSINVRDCDRVGYQGISTTLERSSEGEKIITTRLPSCAKFAFEGASNLVSKLDGTRILRNIHVKYLAPRLQTATRKVSGRAYIASIGNELTVTIKNAAVMYYDFSSQRWVYVP